MGWRAMGQCNNTFTAAATATTSIMHQRCHQQCQRSHQHHAPTPPPSSPPPSPSPPPPSVHIRFVLKSFRPGLNLRNVNNSVGSKLEDFFLLAPGFSSLRSLRSLHDITKPAFGVQRVGLHSPMAYLTLGSPQSGSPSLLAPRILQHPRWSKLFRPPRPPPKCKHCRSGRNDFSTKQPNPIFM